jgi:hypothetical protein
VSGSRHPAPGITFEVATILMRVGAEQAGVHWLLHTLELRPYHRRAHQAPASYYHTIANKDLTAEHRQSL